MHFLMRVGLSSVAVAFLASSFGWSSAAPLAAPPKVEAKEKFRLGVMFSTTGVIADFGMSAKNGVDLAVESINKAGGIHGHEVETCFYDVASKPEEGSAAAKALIGQKVNVCVGAVASGITISAAPTFQEAGIPLISPSATNPMVTTQGDKIFRAVYLDSFQGAALATYAFKDLKCMKAAILSNQDDSYSSGLTKAFADKFKKLGGSVVATAEFRSGDTDFGDHLDQIKKAAPEVLFLPIYYNDVVLLASQCKDKELKVKLLGGDGWESPNLLNAKEVLEGAVFGTHFHPERTDASAAFAKAYKAKFHDEEPDSLAALGYDTVYMIKAAAESQRDVTPAVIAEGLRKLKDFSGVTGSSITMTDTRDPAKPMQLVQIKDGEFVHLREFKPEELEPEPDKPKD